MANLNHLPTMLVVEDEAIILLDIEATLRGAGVANVLSATSVAEAMVLIDATLFDAAVLDLHLGPNSWTYDLAHRLRAAGTPFVFSSGTVDVVDGFHDVPLIIKPYSSDQLLAAVLQVTAVRQAQAAQ